MIVITFFLQKVCKQIHVLGKTNLPENYLFNYSFLFKILLNIVKDDINIVHTIRLADSMDSLTLQSKKYFAALKNITLTHRCAS